MRRFDGGREGGRDGGRQRGWVGGSQCRRCACRVINICIAHVLCALVSRGFVCVGFVGVRVCGRCARQHIQVSMLLPGVPSAVGTSSSITGRQPSQGPDEPLPPTTLANPAAQTGPGKGAVEGRGIGGGLRGVEWGQRLQDKDLPQLISVAMLAFVLLGVLQPSPTLAAVCV